MFMEDCDKKGSACKIAIPPFSSNLNTTIPKSSQGIIVERLLPSAAYIVQKFQP